MKIDEPFNSSIKSATLPTGILFRMANRQDSDSINTMTAERNPSQNFADIVIGTERELDRMEKMDHYKLYVAELDDKVIGFCRFAHSHGLPANKKVFPAPEGWYGLGILVSPHFRRRKVAEFLSTQRVAVLKELGATELYSVVDSTNLTSMKMHQKFGFIEISRAHGFLHIGFNGGIGCLFKLSI